MRFVEVARPGLEPDHLKADQISYLQQSADNGGAKSGANMSDTASECPDLDYLIRSWNSLPRPLQIGIVAMLEASISSNTDASLDP